MIFKYKFYQSENGLTKEYISNDINSDFIKALSDLTECNHLIAEYVDTIAETGGIGPVMMANGAVFNFSDKDFNNPVVKRILVVEILLPYMSNK
jgi:hypothetical protein